MNRSDGGVDSSFSLEPDELKALCEAAGTVWSALGDVSYGCTSVEEPCLKFRRSLYVVEDMEEGDIFNTVNVRAIRPGDGLAPKHMSEILGRRIAQKVDRGTPLDWDLVETP